MPPEIFTSPAAAQTPLSGLTVLDFSRVLAGPMASMMLADMGADVVKVEHPRGDDTRGWGPPWTEHGSAYFASVNRSKSALVLDLKDPDDLAVAQAAAAQADVVIDNFKAGTMARLGLSYDELAPANPGVITCSITGFGTGPGASLPGYDFLVQAMGGLMSITGEPDGEPTKVGVALVDVLTGKDAVIGILAALQERARTGRGQAIEVSLLGSLTASLVNQSSGYLATGTSPSRMGNAHPSIVPYQLLHCADGPLAIAVGNDAQFASLARVIQRPELASDPRFATNAARVRHRDDTIAELESAMRAKPARHWADLLMDAGVPAGTVNTVADGIALAQQLDVIDVINFPDGHTAQVGHPIRYSRSHLRTPTPPPPAPTTKEQ